MELRDIRTDNPLGYSNRFEIAEDRDRRRHTFGNLCSRISR